MVSVQDVAYYLGTNSDDEDEARTIENMIESSYAQLLASTGKDWRYDEGAMSPIVYDTVCGMCYLQYYNNRDDSQNSEHLKSYIGRNIFTLQLHASDEE